jgi:hypothetical protein
VTLRADGPSNAARHRGEMLGSRSDRIISEEKVLGTYCVGNWMGPRDSPVAVTERKFFEDGCLLECYIMQSCRYWPTFYYHPDDGDRSHPRNVLLYISDYIVQRPRKQPQKILAAVRT